MRSCVKVNLTSENLNIKLNEEATQTEILESLKKKITQLKKLYKEDKDKLVSYTTCKKYACIDIF